MTVTDVFTFATEHYSDLVFSLFAFLGFASAVARITPTKADDDFVQKLLDIVHALGLTKPEAKV